ncbi:hypothetical protein QE435_004748 [Rhizobium sp. SORGH_AS 787]|nr:hypothetical protein [Rhizobium sp. SORGH_AS_0787]
MAVWGACSQTRVTSAIFRVKICCFTQRRFVSPAASGRRLPSGTDRLFDKTMKQHVCCFLSGEE